MAASVDRTIGHYAAQRRLAGLGGGLSRLEEGDSFFEVCAAKALHEALLPRIVRRSRRYGTGRTAGQFTRASGRRGELLLAP
jgi:hypothetical protein